MARRLKEIIVGELADRFRDLPEKGCVVVDCTGVNGQDSFQMRSRMSQDGVRMTVVRNAMFHIALDQVGVPGLKPLVDGPTAIVDGQDAVSAARATQEAAKTVPALTVRGGYAEGHLLDPAGVQRLADLPDRETLLAQTVGCVAAPARRLAGCLAGALVRLAGLLEELRKKREEGSPEETQGGEEEAGASADEPPHPEP